MQYTEENKRKAKIAYLRIINMVNMMIAITRLLEAIGQN